MNNCNDPSCLYYKVTAVLMPIVMVLSIAIPVFLIVHVPFYFSSKVESKIFNEKFGTHYTAHDFYWSRETIKKLHEESVPERPEKKIIELNRPLIEVQT